MRLPAHWTPRYAVDRFTELIDRLRHPQDPWLTRHANVILESYLRPSDTGVEFGSGRSTLWFARHVAALTSVEHDPKWFARISKALMEKGLGNVTYLLVQVPDSAEAADTSEYVRVLERFPVESLDFVLVDGILRVECAIAALKRLRQGGILILDNSNWYLPTDSHAPGSRRVEDRPASPRWEEFNRLSAMWRKARTSDGVTDTTFFFRPCSD